MQTGDPVKCHVDRNTHTDSENKILSLSSLDGQALASKIGLQDNLNRKIIDNNNNDDDNILLMILLLSILMIITILLLLLLMLIIIK